MRKYKKRKRFNLYYIFYEDKKNNKLPKHRVRKLRKSIFMTPKS